MSTEAITDTSDVVLTHVALSLAAESESQVIVVRVPCVAGMSLAAGEAAAAQVLARRTGSGEAFVDLHDSPILLTPWAGATLEFDLKVAASAVAGRAFAALPVRVTFNP